jgi:hypothetical protein
MTTAAETIELKFSPDELLSLFQLLRYCRDLEAAPGSTWPPRDTPYWDAEELEFILARIPRVRAMLLQSMAQTFPDMLQPLT